MNYGARITWVCVSDARNGIIKQISCGLLAHVGSSEDKNVMVQGRVLWRKNDKMCRCSGIRKGL